MEDLRNAACGAKKISSEVSDAFNKIIDIMTCYPQGDQVEILKVLITRTKDSLLEERSRIAAKHEYVDTQIKLLSEITKI